MNNLLILFSCINDGSQYYKIIFIINFETNLSERMNIIVKEQITWLIYCHSYSWNNLHQIKSITNIQNI